MEDVDFSDEFCRFVQAHLPSVEAVELLLAAFRNPDVAHAGAAKELDALRAAGLSEAQIARHLATLAQAYEQRPVTLFRLVYALRDQKIQSFADAFKLRKD